MQRNRDARITFFLPSITVPWTVKARLPRVAETLPWQAQLKSADRRMATFSLSSFLDSLSLVPQSFPFFSLEVCVSLFRCDEETHSPNLISTGERKERLWVRPSIGHCSMSKNGDRGRVDLAAAQEGTLQNWLSLFFVFLAETTTVREKKSPATRLHPLSHHNDGSLGRFSVDLLKGTFLFPLCHHLLIQTCPTSC